MRHVVMAYPAGRAQQARGTGFNGVNMNPLDWLKKNEVVAETPAPGMDEMNLEDRVIYALRTVYDPEIPVNIYDLGLIYDIAADEKTGKVDVKMTLTAAGCPVAQTFPGTVKERIEMVEGVDEASVELVWEPPWSQDHMSEAAKLELGML
jgi:FeS assembly SUF system protein